MVLILKYPWCFCLRCLGIIVVILVSSLAEKKHTVPSLDGEKKGKKSTVKDQSSPVHSGKQSTERQLGPPGISVPPSSPAHLFEQLNSEFTPFWNQLDMLPQELLKHLLPEEKTVPCPEMKTQLAMMRKKGPLKKSRPDSAISARMFLSVHRLTLQILNYPRQNSLISTSVLRWRLCWKPKRGPQRTFQPVRLEEAGTLSSNY